MFYCLSFICPGPHHLLHLYFLPSLTSQVFYLFHANAEHFFFNCRNYLILRIIYGPNMNLTEGFGSVK